MLVAGQCLMLGSILQALGVALTVGQMAGGIVLAQLSSALPVAAVGTFGVYEAGWITGFLLVGLDLGTAAFMAVASQLVTLGFAGVLDGLGWIGLRGRTPAPARGASAAD